MGLNAEGYWQPDLCEKQCVLFNTTRKFVLASGPVRSTKTVGCLNRLLRHAWEIPQPRIGIFARTVKSAFAGGVWSDLTEIVLPQWLNANMGMRITKGPKVDGATRLHHLKVSNMHGGESEIQLRSLDYDWDITAIIKSARFSMFYFSELSNFQNRIVFTDTSERLRMTHLREDQHLWLADTNPADDGTASWIYKLFYDERLAENHPFPDVQAKFQVIEFSLDDNIWMTESERNEIFSRYAHDEERKQRYCYGKWTTSTEKGLFSDVFLADTHVLGNLNAFDEEESELILPSETCSTMVSGWDFGSMNNSAHIFEQIGADGDQNSRFHVLDEIVSLNSMLPLEDFAYLADERIAFWNKFISEHCHSNQVLWRHWSDQAAFVNYNSALGGFEHTAIAVATEGRVMLAASPKGRGSVFKRVDLLRRLLYQNRLFVSARCVQTIKMLGSLRAGKTKMEPVHRNEMCHVFDSLTYALAAQLVNEMAENWTPRLGSTSSMVSIRL